MITITFIAIVRNESKIIERCLQSILPIIDHIVISDTGSTDNTIELIEKFMLVHKIQGKVYKNEWKNFGINRSLSVTNAQEWLRETGINMETNFLLTIDADMILKITPEFTKDSLKDATQWHVSQKNPEISYYNTRFMRSDLPFKCVGVTHEFWGCDKHHVTKKINTIYIEDIGDGGSKADKYSRDISLLTQGLIDEPNNERYLFYLAQSYECFGNHEKAIEFFEKRIKAGGYIEEVFIAHNRVGNLYYSLNQQEKAFCSWLNGYECLPRRSETLFRIINKLRWSGKNYSAMMYLKTALKIPYPTDLLLFIEYGIYDYKLIEELSILGYYTNNFKEALIATQYLTLSQTVPKAFHDLARNNMLFYFGKLNWINYYKFNLEYFDSQEIYKPSSSCILNIYQNQGKNNFDCFECIVRAVNYSITDKFKYIIRDPDNIVRTKNYFVRKINDYIEYSEIICTAPVKRTTYISGLEDLRVVYIYNPDGTKKMYGLAVDWERGEIENPSIVVTHFTKSNVQSANEIPREYIPNESHSQTEYIIDKVVPTNYKNNTCQKNWTPFTENGKFFAIYSHNPLTIVEINPDTGDTKVIIEKKSNVNTEHFRGSSIPVKLSDGSYLLIIHEVIEKDTRKYFHRFLKYSRDWVLIDISIPFYFQKLFVEFTLSLYLDNNILTIPFSTQDNTFEMFTLNIEKIPWLPKKENSLDEINMEYFKEWIVNNI